MILGLCCWFKQSGHVWRNVAGTRWDLHQEKTYPWDTSGPAAGFPGKCTMYLGWPSALQVFAIFKLEFSVGYLFPYRHLMNCQLMLRRLKEAAAPWVMTQLDFHPHPFTTPLLNHVDIVLLLNPPSQASCCNHHFIQILTTVVDYIQLLIYNFSADTSGIHSSFLTIQVEVKTPNHFLSLRHHLVYISFWSFFCLISDSSRYVLYSFLLIFVKIFISAIAESIHLIHVDSWLYFLYLWSGLFGYKYEYERDNFMFSFSICPNKNFLFFIYIYTTFIHLFAYFIFIYIH